jgi:hypothetical protein
MGLLFDFYVGGFAAFAVCMLLALVALFLGGTRGYRGPLLIYAALLWGGMMATYLALWQDNGVWQRSDKIKGVNIEVAWSRYAGYVWAAVWLGAIASDYLWHALAADGWYQLVFLVLAFAKLLASALSVNSMRYWWWSFGVGSLLFTVVGYWWGAQLRRYKGGMWRTIGFWGMLALGSAGIFVAAICDRPWTNSWTHNWHGQLTFLLADLVLWLALPIYAIVTSAQADGDALRYAGVRPHAQ